ncbi:MAG: rsmA, partial [Acidobacteria bacterium]|nr:rsmA [Acidobacteriota bacterium]
MKTRRGKREGGRGNREDGRRTDRSTAVYPRARKRFGQHFLERAWVDKLIAALGTSPDDTFLEIGPGRGALTRALAPHVARIVAVEIDRDLAAALPARAPSNVRVVTGDFLNVRVVTGDFLTVDLDEVLRDEPQPLRVVGNLPYNVASPILFRLLHAADHGRRFHDATLMLQKEVADRLAAPAGAAGYGALAVQVGVLA